MATTHFGHDLLWPRHSFAMTYFGHDLLWPGRLWPRPGGLWPQPSRLWPQPHGPIMVGPSRFGPTPTASDRPPLRTAHRFGPPKISRFFSFSRPHFHSFFTLWGSSRVFFSLSRCLLVSFFPLAEGLLEEFWWCFGRSGPQMCLFSPSRCPVKPRRPATLRALTLRALTLRALTIPALTIPALTIPALTLQPPPPFVPPPFGPPTFSGFGSPPLWAPVPRVKTSREKAEWLIRKFKERCEIDTQMIGEAADLDKQPQILNRTARWSSRGL